jgi:hypothetical protein
MPWFFSFSFGILVVAQAGHIDPEASSIASATLYFFCLIESSRICIDQPLVDTQQIAYREACLLARRLS